MNSRSLIPVGLTALLLSGVAGCKKKPKCSFTPTANTTVKAKFTQN